MSQPTRRHRSTLLGIAAGLVAGLVIGTELISQDAPQAMLDAAAARQKRFDELLYGSEGKRQYLDALKLRMTEMCELLEEDTERADRFFYLGMSALMNERGVVIPGRNVGVQVMGGVEIDLASFDEGATEWILAAPKTIRILPEDSLLKEQLGEAGELRLPKGHFVKYVTRDGVYDGGTDPAELGRYALLVGLGDEALIVYPNDEVNFPSWVAWVPGKTLSGSWERPALPQGVHR